MSIKKRLEIALLGLGRAGKFHIQSIQSLPELKLSHVVDVDENRAREVADLMDCRHSSDFESVLSHGTPDGVIIATPTGEHYKQIMFFLSRGIPVFTEKPLGYSTREIDDCFEKSHEMNVPLLVGFNRRFDPTFASLAQNVRDGSVGIPQMIRITSRDSPLPTMEYIKHSHGIFHDCIVHDFDMLRFITGQDPIEIYAAGSSFVEGIGKLNDFDNVLVSLRYESGLIASIDVNRFASYGYDQRIEVFGSKGMVQAENRSPTSTLISNESGLTRPPIEFSFPSRYNEAYREELVAFSHCIRNKSKSPVSHKDVINSHILCNSGEIACREKKPVSLDW